MRLISTLLILAYFISASTAQPLLTIKGKTENLRSDKAYLFFVNSVLSDTILVDSTTVTQQQFSFKQSIKEPKQAFIMLENHSGKVAFLWDNNIEISLNDRLSNTSSVINSVATTEWYGFLAGIDSTYEQSVVTFDKQKATIRQKREKSVIYDSSSVMMFVRTGMHLQRVRWRQIASFRESHPLSWVNLFLLCWYRSELGRVGVYQLMIKLPTHIKESSLYRQLDLALQDMN